MKAALSLPLGVGTVHPAEGGAAGLATFLAGFKAAAMNVLNYTTYFEMKARAGTVGKNGVAKLIDKLAPQVERIHLIGHSFGGRVVTATAANSSTDKIKSMSLLQTAFSHNGFSKSMNGFFRGVVDQKRVNGPILVTHTKNDKAVGVAYPLASRINGDVAAAFGDENDKFGGLGRNGAQKMENDEVIKGNLLDAGGNYSFQAGKFFNLEGSDFIKGHGDVTGKEVAHAVRKAIAKAAELLGGAGSGRWRSSGRDEAIPRAMSRLPAIGELARHEDPTEPASKFKERGTLVDCSSANRCFTARRSLIAARRSAITSSRGFAPRLPLPWTRTLTALASMSRFPITSMVWTFICSALAILALMWSLLASSSARTSWARSSA